MIQKKSSGLVLVRPDPKEFGGQRRSGLWDGLAEHGIGALEGWAHHLEEHRVQHVLVIRRQRAASAKNRCRWAARGNEEQQARTMNEGNRVTVAIEYSQGQSLGHSE